MNKTKLIELLSGMDGEEVYLQIGTICTPINHIYIGSYEVQEDDFIKGRKIYLKEKTAKTKDIIVLEGERAE